MPDETHTAESDAAIREHLERHLTDGFWHDSCPYCLERRRVGGTGVPLSDLPTRVIPPGFPDPSEPA